MKKAVAAATTAALTLALAVFTGAALAGGGNDGGHGYGGGDSQGQSHDALGQGHDSQGQSRGDAHGVYGSDSQQASARGDRQFGESKDSRHEKGTRHDSAAAVVVQKAHRDEAAGHDHAAKSSRHESKSSKGFRRDEAKSSAHESKPAAAAVPATKTESRTHYGAHEKVYICHSTGSATNPYVLIHVSKNALKAHTRHHDGDDVVLGDSVGAGCPQPLSTSTSTTTPTTTAQVAATCVETVTVEVPGTVLHHTGSKTHEWVAIHPSSKSAHYSTHDDDDVVVPATTKTVQVASASCEQAAATPTCTQTVVVEVPGYVLHHTGSEKHPFVKIHPNAHSAHFSKHGDDVVVAATTRTVEVPAACNAQLAATTTTTVAAPTTSTAALTAATGSTTASTTTAESTTTTTAGGVAGTSTTMGGGGQPVANTTPTGGVLGAQATLPQKSSSGGVLGTVTGATLPFTGLPLLPVVLAAFAATALGIGFRRAQRGV